MFFTYKEQFDYCALLQRMDKQSVGYEYFSCQLFFIYHCQISLLDKEKYNGSSYNSDESTNYDEMTLPLGQKRQKTRGLFYIVH